MPLQFWRSDPDQLSRREQLISALLGALCASVAAGAVASVLYLGVIALLRHS